MNYTSTSSRGAGLINVTPDFPIPIQLYTVQFSIPKMARTYGAAQAHLRNPHQNVPTASF